MRVLITNDDGIDSPGLEALAGVARFSGHDVLVAAPCWDSSGASASVTGVTERRGLLVESRSWPGWPVGAVLAVKAAPALICRSALQGDFGPPPDLVLSGINRGLNTGKAILHSGTVGAALTAYQQGRPALAVSLDVTDGAEAYWATAAAVAAVVLDWLASAGRAVAINCNVPGVPAEFLRGIRVARLAPVGTAQTSLTERTGESVALAVGDGDGALAGGGGGGVARDIRTPADRESVDGERVDGEPVDGQPRRSEGEPATDSDLLSEGFASLTAVIPIVEDPTVDLRSAFGRTRS